MATVDIALPDGRTIPFEIADQAGIPARFALGVRKSGSSVFSNIASEIGTRAGLNRVDIAGTFFQKGLRYEDWNRAELLGPLLRPGNVYIGFRDAPTAALDHPVFRAGRKILLVRDPRDALVSEYFSNAYSHSLPSEGTGSVVEVERARALQASLVDYVMGRIEPLNATIDRYRPLLDDPTVLVMRYEAVILAKRAWMERIAGFFELELPEAFIPRTLSWADVPPPEIEEPTNFIRRVRPGDHREKLSPETIRAIDAQLSPTWASLGY